MKEQKLGETCAKVSLRRLWILSFEILLTVLANFMWDFQSKICPLFLIVNMDSFCRGSLSFTAQKYSQKE